ncbi:MAG TPA: glycosyltransferase family 39 protein [Silvibacterium sp.]|nr:glycosyltransferase family 39 protein [Silvibacterium sp.]
MGSITISAAPTSVKRAELRSIVWLALIFAAVKAALHIITNIMAQHAGYGIFRDEMYYLICGQRLAFGYVDQPPMVALAARLTETLFGHDHMWSLRLIPALAGAAKVFLTGMLVWALGGGRRAAALAMLGVMVGGVYLGIDSFLSMNCVEPVFWMTCALALIMIVQAERPEMVRNWWIVLGVSAGLGLENKVSEVFFLVCVLAALLLTPQRRILKSKWFGVAVLLIVLLALPNLLWQIHYHFPTLEWLRDVQNSDKDVKLPPLKFLAGQMMMMNPFTVLLWVSGVLWLLLGKAARPFRFLGVMYLLFLALMMAMHAKDYYLAPVYPVFFAAGGVVRFLWARERAWKNALIGVYALILAVSLFLFVPFSIPVLPPQRFLAYAKAMHITPKDTENHEATILPQFYADRFGWSDLVTQVNTIYHALPPNEQAITGIFAGNYGQASAINLFGPKLGLPQAISGHQNYWIWGPRGYTGQEMIIISGAKPDEIKPYYASCKIVGVRNNPLAMPWEHGNIYLCYGRKKTYAADWNDLKHYY